MYPSTGGGIGSRGDFQNVMTLALMKSFPVAWVQAFLNDINKFFVEGGNQRLFDSIAKRLGDSVLTMVLLARSKRGTLCVQLTLQKISEAGTLPDLPGEPLRVVAWPDHEVSGFGVSAADMREGCMANLYALQRKRATWFTGGGVAADFTPVLWKFNDDRLSRMVKAMQLIMSFDSSCHQHSICLLNLRPPRLQPRNLL